MKKVLAVLAVAAALWASYGIPRSRRIVTDPSHPGMVLVEGGPFLMGDTEEQAQRALEEYGGIEAYYISSVPQRPVALPAFWIDRTEVTNAMYAAFVAATGHPVPTDEHLWAAPYNWVDGAPPPGLESHPVTLVGFDDARDFCRWRGMELPTEEQWEKAARGTDGRRYPWGNEYSLSRLAGAGWRSRGPLDTIDKWTEWWRAVYRGRMRGREVGTFPVGRFPSGASPYGALDMAGNVFEWVDAFFDPYPGATHDHEDFGHGYRVVRGGDWYLDRIYHQAAARLRAPADHRVPTIGFRCACSRTGDRHESVIPPPPVSAVALRAPLGKE